MCFLMKIIYISECQIIANKGNIMEYISHIRYYQCELRSNQRLITAYCNISLITNIQQLCQTKKNVRAYKCGTTLVRLDCIVRNEDK